MNVKNKKTISYFFLGFLSVFVFSFTLFYTFESRAIIVKIDDIKKEEKQLVDFQETLITEKLRLVVGDLKYLENTYSDNLYLDKDLANVAKDWQEFSIQNPHYDQIRYLDELGNEVIRINKNETSAEILDKSQLQNKSDRYYFKETKQLDKDGIFVSPFDLNIEFNEIEIPHKPMIRFASALYDNENNFKGIIILNYLGQNILDDFRSLASNSNGSIALVNSDGYWISCENTKYNFNFMFNDEKMNSFKSFYPQEWKRIINNNHQFVTDNGLFTSLNLELNNKHTSKKNYNEIIETKARWTVVSKVNKNKVTTLSLLNNPISTVKQIFNNNKLALSIITFISFIIGILAYLNKKSYCKVKFFSEYDLLTNAYNRRAGLAKLEKLTYNRDKKVKNFILCF